METRKVQISGGSTFIVSLPKKWAEKSGITSGSPLNIMEDSDGNLIMSPRDPRNRMSITADIKLTGDESPKTLMRRLVGAYISGVSNLQVTFNGNIGPELSRTVREFTRLVMGVEIVEERKDLIMLQDLIDPTDFSVRTGLKRMAYITDNMVEDVLRGMKDMDAAFLEDVVIRDIEVDRINWLIQREYNMMNRSPKISEKSFTGFDDAFDHMLASRIVERVADHAVSMAENLRDLTDLEDPSLIPRIVEQGETARGIFSDSVGSLFLQDMGLADSVVDRSGELRRTLEPMMKVVFPLPADEAVVLANVINSIERIAAYGGDIGKITLNRFTPVKE
ncbi:MAG: AbrB/MazE/SpoVT family DNA-binding domain-containing protein [Candidatus Thermoplasmatota archaeon]|nr:AbrB/MazE/SpoVT family DNA-binding domain-containing protein [Candidatus Thermoplasmatota archaeon]